MRRPTLGHIRRGLLYTMTFGTLLLLLAIFSLWVRSHWRGDQLVCAGALGVLKDEARGELVQVRTLSASSGAGGVALLAHYYAAPLAVPIGSSWNTLSNPTYPESLQVKGLRIALSGNTFSGGQPVGGFVVANAPAPAPTTTPITSLDGLSLRSNSRSTGGPISDLPIDASGLRLGPAPITSATTPASAGTLSIRSSGVSGSAGFVASAAGGAVVTIGSGTLTFSTGIYIPPPPDEPSWLSKLLRVAAYQVNTASYSPSGDITYVLIFPYWIAVLLLSAPAVLLLAVSRRVHRRHVRRRAGLCLNCGYDLRASPQRCPECGAAPAPLPTRSPDPV